MIDISRPLGSAKIQKYFRAEFSEDGRIRGEWVGKLATSLGLEGKPVTEEQFGRMADGQNPVTGEQIIKHRDTIKTRAGEEIGHRAGWDLCFSVAKTVSITAVVGGDERIRDAHTAAVRTALREVEEYVQAQGKSGPETTGKFLAAVFEHDHARPVNGYPAPHLHSHVIVGNMTDDRTGQARSLEPVELFRIQGMASAIYAHEMELELRRLGYETEIGTNHAVEISGYTKDYIEVESPRGAQIKAEMMARGLKGPEAGQRIAHQVRENKIDLRPEQLQALHRAHAERFGNQSTQVVRQAEYNLFHRKEEGFVPGAAREAVAFAKRSLSEHDAVFEHSSVIREAVRFARWRASVAEIKREIALQRSMGKLIAVQHIRPQAPMYRYTIPETIKAERETIEAVLETQGNVYPIGLYSDETLAARYPQFNEWQRKVIRETLASEDRVFGIQGSAGTGKTSILAAVRELAHQNWYEMRGMAPTSKAAKSLRNAGVTESQTMQSFLLSPYDKPTAKRMYVLDESSLADTNQMREFLGKLHKDDRVLMVGDRRQHQSVGAGRIFESLQLAGMKVARINKLVRQTDPELREVIAAQAQGNVSRAVDLLTVRGRIHEVGHRGDRFEALAKMYVESPEETLVVSPDNKSRMEINDAIRKELKASGKLGKESAIVPVMVSRQDVTGAQRELAGSYRIGDSVRYGTASKKFGLKAGEYATVKSVNQNLNVVTVKRADSTEISYDPKNLKGVTIYAPQLREISASDRIQFTAPWKEKAISNRDTAIVEHIDQQGNMRVRMDDSGRTVGWNIRKNAHFDHGYAMTSHSSQSMTVNRVLLHVDTSDPKVRKLVSQTLGYVGLSRARKDAHIFTDDASRLGEALSRKVENSTALSRKEISSYQGFSA